MDRSLTMFTAKLEELSQEYTRLAERIALCQTADHHEIRREKQRMEAEWQEIEQLMKGRVRAMRFLTAQQLSQVQLEYCHRANEILRETLQKAVSSMPGATEADNMVLYAEYAIDLAALATRYALMAAVSAIDLQMTVDEQVAEEGAADE